MRALVLPLFCLSVTGFAQTGTYRPATGTEAVWSVGNDGDLTWAGAPFRPGAGSVTVDLPAASALADGLAKGEASGKPFLLRLAGPAPTVRGWTVRPQSFRAEIGSGPLTLTLPGAESALVLVAAKRDGLIRKRAKVDVVGGRLVFDPGPQSVGEPNVVLVYPFGETNESDLWEGWDRLRDDWVAALRTAKPGPHFRGVVDPAGVTGSGDELPEAVPVSPVFRNELRTLLEERYRNVDTAIRAWGLPGGTIVDWEGLCRAVPLWNGLRGLRSLYDPQKDQVYGVDSRSAAWTDIRDALRNTVVRRHARLVRAIKAVADVPVLTTWRGWGPLVEDPATEYDGFVARIDATSPSRIYESAARPLSSALRRGRVTWLLADASGPVDGAVADDLSAFGYAGSVRSDATSWPSPGRPTPVYFPEAAANPAAAQRLPGGRVWLPAPYAGAALDLGTGWYAYRMNDKTASAYALWTSQPTRTKLLVLKPKEVTFESTDGRDPAPKIVKGGVEVTVGSVPLIVRNVADVPVPLAALDDTRTRVALLFKKADAMRRSIVQERVLIERNLKGMEVNPGGNFLAVRAYLDVLEGAVNDFTWAETEATRTHTFGEIKPVVGASGNAVLSLQNRVLQDVPYFAEFKLPVRTDADQTLWIAMRTAATPLDRVVVKIGSQVMIRDPRPVGRYGDGYAWYSFGLTKLAGPTASLRIEVPGDLYHDLQIDSLLLTPGNATPDGIRMIRP